jgi:hypothetical protein
MTSRLLELILILAVIIIFSVLAGSVNERFENVDTMQIVSKGLSDLGIDAIAGNPVSSANKSYIAYVPTFDDLLKSDYLKKEFTNGVSGLDSIMARTCTDGNTSSLMGSIDSNKKSCDILIDLQPYKFMAKTLQLNVYTDTSRSNDTEIQIVVNKPFLEFILRRPVVFTVNNSIPYRIDWERFRDRFLFTNYTVPGVEEYKSNTIATVPIKAVAAANSQFFPSNTQTISAIFQQKDSKTTPMSQVTVNIYYLKRKSIDSRVTGSSMDSLGKVTRLNPTFDYAEIKDNIVDSYKFVKPPLTESQLKNPTFSITFRVKVRTPDDTAQWTADTTNLVSIGSNVTANNNTCNIQTSGIANVSISSLTSRQQNNRPFYESSPMSNFVRYKYACLDFKNTLTSYNSPLPKNPTCDENIGCVWIRTDVETEIAYIVSSTMKVIVAKYFDPDEKEYKVSYTQMYFVDSSSNGLVDTIRALDKLFVCNQAQKNQYGHVVVTDIETTYGMIDLNDWYFN